MTAISDADFQQLQREHEAKQAAELLQQIQAAGPELVRSRREEHYRDGVVSLVTVLAEYELGADVLLYGDNFDRTRPTRRVTRVQVEKRVPTEKEDARDPEAYFITRLYGTPLTKAGKPSKSEAPSWSWAFDGIARELLAHNTDDVDTASSASRQHYIDTGCYLLVGQAIETNLVEDETPADDVALELYRALGVLTSDPFLVTLLERLDPQALKQARAARDAFRSR